MSGRHWHVSLRLTFRNDGGFVSAQRDYIVHVPTPDDGLDMNEAVRRAIEHARRAVWVIGAGVADFELLRAQTIDFPFELPRSA